MNFYVEYSKSIQSINDKKIEMFEKMLSSFVDYIHKDENKTKTKEDLIKDFLKPCKKINKSLKIVNVVDNIQKKEEKKNKKNKKVKTPKTYNSTYRYFYYKICQEYAKEIREFNKTYEGKNGNSSFVSSKWKEVKNNKDEMKQWDEMRHEHNKNVNEILSNISSENEEESKPVFKKVNIDLNNKKDLFSKLKRDIESKDASDLPDEFDKLFGKEKKRNISPFVLFSQSKEIKEIVKKKMNDIVINSVKKLDKRKVRMKVLKDIWNEMTDEQKKKYNKNGFKYNTNNKYEGFEEDELLKILVEDTKKYMNFINGDFVYSKYLPPKNLKTEQFFIDQMRLYIAERSIHPDLRQEFCDVLLTCRKEVDECIPDIYKKYNEDQWNSDFMRECNELEIESLKKAFKRLSKSQINFLDNYKDDYVNYQTNRFKEYIKYKEEYDNFDNYYDKYDSKLEELIPELKEYMSWPEYEHLEQLRDNDEKYHKLYMLYKLKEIEEEDKEYYNISEKEQEELINKEIEYEEKVYDIDEKNDISEKEKEELINKELKEVEDKMHKVIETMSSKKFEIDEEKKELSEEEIEKVLETIEIDDGGISENDIFESCVSSTDESDSDED